MKILFSPSAAIKYIGKDSQEFKRSVIRPFPIVENSDIIIMTPVDAHNTVRLFPTEWEHIKDINIDNDVVVLNERILELESENAELSLIVAKHDIDDNSSQESNHLITIKKEADFNEDIDSLLEYALDEFGIELIDSEKTFNELYTELYSVVNADVQTESK